MFRELGFVRARTGVALRALLRATKLSLTALQIETLRGGSHPIDPDIVR